ncbi:RHS repeat-associated core domain-containing protein [Pelagicoccus enzymogenes]|uniref:RHS repeat-associated core domain-containing protein n=1 Tax=Pelagicoccus enzymogenes TaxID=2773457 RepID=UPI00280D310D|nr:RHS repeat-associated core domain-containing protein [Pelagicoccus enzymogenes]MDQ8201193.1 RHS repeat-associated core domain-containing protein [Pelagicoccus enzymogenes]
MNLTKFSQLLALGVIVSAPAIVQAASPVAHPISSSDHYDVNETITITQTYTDSDGNLKNTKLRVLGPDQANPYRWSEFSPAQGAILLGSGSSATVSYDFSFSQRGVYNILGEVWDQSNAYSNSQKAIKVGANLGSPPNVDLIEVIHLGGDTVRIKSKLSDIDGNLGKAYMYLMRIGDNRQEIGQFDISGVSHEIEMNSEIDLDGTYEIHVGVYDSLGWNHGHANQFAATNFQRSGGNFATTSSTYQNDPAWDLLPGTLAGDVSVDNKGSANYSIPLEVPPGREGMQPSLAINYNSQGGNGPMGVGWNFSHGLPKQITRGRTIYARDGFYHGPSFDDDDKFYLDGKRLIKTSGTYNLPGSWYRTEVDDFSKIKAVGSGSNIEGFEVHMKSGAIAYFGKHSSFSFSDTDGYQTLHGFASDSAMQWAVKRVEDLNGNFVTFDYNEGSSIEGSLGDGEYVLTSINWGNGADDSKIASVELLYNQYFVPSIHGGQILRRDRYRSYLARRVTESTARLDIVEVKNQSGDKLRAYHFDYAYGTVETAIDEVEGLTQLQSISVSLHEGDSPAILNPTEFQYENASLIFGDIESSGDSNDYSGHGGTNAGSVTADFDHDGIEDVIQTLTVSQPNPNHFKIITSLSAGQNQTFDLGTLLPRKLVASDFNADGYSDMVYFASTKVTDFGQHLTNQGGWYVALFNSTTNKFDTPVEVLDLFVNSNARTNTNGVGATFREGAADVVDIDGDGYPDIVTVVDAAPFALFGGAPIPVASAVRVAEWRDEYNNDLTLVTEGKAPDSQVWANVSLLPANPTHGKLYFFKNRTAENNGLPYVGSALSQAKDAKIPQNDGLVISDYSVGLSDINGDSLPDLVYDQVIIEVDPIKYTLEVSTAINQGDFSFSGVSAAADYSVFDVTQYDSPLVKKSLTDLNGDGFPDLAFLLYGEPAQGSETAVGWRFELNRGDGTFTKAFDDMELSIDYGSHTLETYHVRELGDWFEGIDGGDGSAGDVFLESYTPTFIDGYGFADVNGDSMSDFVWGIWSGDQKGTYAALSLGDKFDTENLIKIHSQPIFDSTPGAYVIAPGDLDGDLIGDFRTYVAASGQASVSLGRKNQVIRQGPSHSRLELVTNGLGRQTQIHYKPTTDSDVYKSGAEVEFPIRENYRYGYVVSDVWKDYGGDFNGADGIAGNADDDSHRFTYVYSGARTDLSGRGDLGFHSFVTFDTKTNLLSYQFLTQSFPMTGLVKREQTLRRGSGSSLRQLGWTDHTVVFDEVRDPGDASVQYGTLFPMNTKSVVRKWEDSDSSNVSADPNDPEAIWDLSPANVSGDPYFAVETQVLYDTHTSVKTSLPTGYTAFDQTVHGKENKAETNALLAELSSPSITSGNVVKTTVEYDSDYKDTTTTTYRGDDYITGRYVGGLVETSQTEYDGPGTDYDVTGPTTTYDYHRTGTAAGKLSSQVVSVPGNSALGTTTTYSYHSTGSAAGLLEKVTLASSAPVGSVYHFASRDTQKITAYDSTGRFPATTANDYDHETQTRYDHWGRPVKTWDVNRSESQAIFSEYDALGRPTKVTDPLLAQPLVTTTTYEFDSGNLVGTPTEAESRGAPVDPVEIVYKSTTTSTKQPPVTTYFDRLGQAVRVEKTGYADTIATTDTLYDSYGRVVAVSTPHETVTEKHWSYTRYDALGRVKEVLAPAFGSVGAASGAESKTVKTTTKYHGRITQVTVTDNTQTPAEVQVTATQTDAKGQTVAVWNADNSIGTLNSNNYDGVATTSASIFYDLDAAGRMRKTRLRGNDGSIDSDLVVAATYDPLGNQLTLKDPDKGGWEYTYDALGQLRSQTNAKLDVTTQTYDALGRMLTREVEESGSTTERTDWYYWDQSSDDATHRVARTLGDGVVGPLQLAKHTAYQASGQDYIHQVAYHYNALGQLVYDLHSVDGKLYYFYADYDGYGRLDKRTYFWRPDGLEDNYTDQVNLWNRYGLDYDYDPSYSYVETIYDSQGRAWWEAVGDNAYDLLDRPAQFKKGNGHVTTRTYDPATQLMTGIRTGASNAIQDLEYKWDGLGNLTRREDGARYETFGYDTLNRLTHQGIQSATPNTEIATYDDIGNILKKIEVGQQILDKRGISQTGATLGTDENDFVYGSSRPHAVTQAGGWTMGYDANGNMNERYKGTSSNRTDEWSYDWTSFDKPRHLDNGARGSEFHYDANRQRTVHYKYGRVGTERQYTSKKVYVGGNMEIDFTNIDSADPQKGDLQAVRIYIDGPDGRSGAYEYRPRASDHDRRHDALVYHQDHLGSIHSITKYAKDDHDKESVFSYDPWGQRRDPGDWNVGLPDTESGSGGTETLTPRGFTDHEMLDDLGLVHMNGRIYDPLLGRFLSADAIVDGVKTVQGYNRYSYVKNNPLSLRDPSGYSGEVLHEGSSSWRRPWWDATDTLNWNDVNSSRDDTLPSRWFPGDDPSKRPESEIERVKERNRGLPILSSDPEGEDNSEAAKDLAEAAEEEVEKKKAQREENWTEEPRILYRNGASNGARVYLLLEGEDHRGNPIPVDAHLDLDIRVDENHRTGEKILFLEYSKGSLRIDGIRNPEDNLKIGRDWGVGELTLGEVSFASKVDVSVATGISESSMFSANIIVRDQLELGLSFSISYKGSKIDSVGGNNHNIYFRDKILKHINPDGSRTDNRVIEFSFEDF